MAKRQANDLFSGGASRTTDQAPRHAKKKRKTRMTTMSKSINHANDCEQIIKKHEARIGPAERENLSKVGSLPAASPNNTEYADTDTLYCSSDDDDPIQLSASLEKGGSADYDNGLLDSELILEALQHLVMNHDQEPHKGERTEPGPESPLSVLPDDLLARIGTFLNVGSLQSCQLVSKQFRTLFSRGDAGWVDHCQRLWKSKVHVSPKARQLLQSNHQEETTALQAYRLSCKDARLRHSIDNPLQELLYDPERGSTTIWNFRFKQAAGEEWTAFDPWHRGEAARQMVFLPNGTIKQVVATSNMGGSGSSFKEEELPDLRTPFYDDASESGAGGVEITWRFISHPIDLPPVDPAMGGGAYLRLTVGGRDVPTYVVHRSPTNNWGFVIENCWGVFASFELPLRLTTTQSQAEEDSIDQPQSAAFVEAQHARLLQDEKLPITNSWQWREALLYNMGSTKLPDGPTATQEFDKAWTRAAQRIQSLGIPNVMEHLRRFAGLSSSSSAIPSSSSAPPQPQCPFAADNAGHSSRPRRP